MRAYAKIRWKANSEKFVYVIVGFCGSLSRVVSNMQWNKVWIPPFYLVDFVVCVGVSSCLIYFVKHRMSPLVKCSHSNVDNGILMTLCLFSIFPVIHFAEMSTLKCLGQWSVQNIMYAIYCGLLFTKMPYFKKHSPGRRKACEQAKQIISEQQLPTLRAKQEFTYSALFVMLPIVITTGTLPFSANDEIKSTTCPSRVSQCPIQGTLSIFTSTAYTWSLLLSLSVLALIENHRGMNSWKIPWLILIGFLSYTALICFSYLKLQCLYDSWFSSVVYLTILINPVVCLITIYLPKLHLTTTCLLHLKSFRKSFRNMRKASRHLSTGEVIVNYSLHAGPHEEIHASSDLASTRPASSISDTNTRILNIQKSVQIISNLFQPKEYQSVRRQSLYDNVPQPGIKWDYISQSSFAETVDSDVDFESFDESECGSQATEITFEELREMAEFLKGLKSSDV